MNLFPNLIMQTIFWIFVMSITAMFHLSLVARCFALRSVFIMQCVCVCVCVVTEWKADERRLVSPDMSTILFKSIKKADTMVLQCNASNVHGYSFDNAILNVIC